MKETKIFPGYVLKADEDTGIVDAYVSVMGIVDEDWPPDMIENGAFTKTIQERGPAGTNKIRVLHQHHWSEVIGKPLVIVEHGREQLPAELLEKYPSATGGLFTRTQFILDVQRAREDFALYKSGAMDEWSIGFDTLDSDMDKTNGESFRRIKEVRMWEYSPVTWGANQATMTTDVKDNEVDESNQGMMTSEEFIAHGKEVLRKDKEADERIKTLRAETRIKLDEVHKLLRATEAIRKEKEDNERDEDVPLVEPSELDEHLQEEAEPRNALTSGEVAQLKQDGIDADFNLTFRMVQDE